MLTLPQCPQSVDEMFVLVYALTNDKYRLSPDEQNRRVDEELAELRKKGFDEKMIKAYGRIMKIEEEDEEYLKQMRKWGGNQREAGLHFIRHINSPCNWCLDVYTDLTFDIAEEMAEDEGIVNPYENPAKIMEFLEKAHASLLGKLKPDCRSKLSLANILAHPN